MKRRIVILNVVLAAVAVFAAPTVSAVCKWCSLRRWVDRAARRTRRSSCAGYAACFHSAVKGVAADKNVAIGESTVEAHVGIGLNDNGPGGMIAPSCT